MTHNTRENFAKLAHSVKYRIEQQKTPNEEGANKALQILIDTHHQELQKAREQAYKDGARDVRDFAQVEIMKRASQLRDDIATFTSETIQSELDQPTV